MGGTNPYMRSETPAPPKQAYRVTFLPMNRVIEVDPSALPYERDGQIGSILDIALGHGIEVDHACGGVCACSTCHVVFREGAETCNEPTDEELDQLDCAPGLEAESRLACQAVPDGSRDVVIEVPDWNRNLVREEHH